MDKTPVISRSRLSCRRNNFAGTSTDTEPRENVRTISSASFLDTRMVTDAENDESPSQIACTQEGCENVDVIWDWNSPQSARKPKRSQKRLILQSPKIPLKRYPSNNQIQDFEKLREELQLLREQIAHPDNEDSLVLSPLEEAEYKDVSSVLNKSAASLTEDNHLAQDEDDLFNDSIDEQLLLFSQKIESDLNSIGQANQLSTNYSVKQEQSFVKKQISDLNSVKINYISVNNIKSEIVGEIVETSDTEDIGEVTQVVHRTDINQNSKNNHSFPKTRSQDQHTTSKLTNSGKVEFPRTHSFESTFDNRGIIPQSKLDDIERKRKEALAKLELKKKQDSSPIKCTPQEIEQKRLQALAKREAKKQQEIIERNRREALKRLELSRRKNVTIGKKFVIKRS